jgi:hypothetical protein
MSPTQRLESLLRNEMIEYVQEEDFNGRYTISRLTAKGIGWLLANQDRFRMIRDEEAAMPSQITDDDIPF